MLPKGNREYKGNSIKEYFIAFDWSVLWTKDHQLFSCIFMIFSGTPHLAMFVAPSQKAKKCYIWPNIRYLTDCPFGLACCAEHAMLSPWKKT